MWVVPGHLFWYGPEDWSADVNINQDRWWRSVDLSNPSKRSTFADQGVN